MIAAILGASVWLTDFSGGSTTTHSDSILAIVMQQTISTDINVGTFGYTACTECGPLITDMEGHVV